MSEPSMLVIERETVLLNRRQARHLIRVQLVVGDRVFVNRVDEFGLRPKSARRRKELPVSQVQAAYQLYRPCRWQLDCLAQATVTVGHSLGDIDACAEHAAEYEAWLKSIEGVPCGQWDREPEPSCWCTDIDIETGFNQRYCPRHGTPEWRGTNMGDMVPASGTAGPVLAGPDRGLVVPAGFYADA